MKALELLLIIWIIWKVIKRIKRATQERPYRIKTKQTKTAMLYDPEKEKEKQRKKEQIERKKQFEIEQAVNDNIAYDLSISDYRKLYNYYDSIFNDPDKPDKQRLQAMQKMITLNGKVQAISKKIERNNFIINENERNVK